MNVDKNIIKKVNDYYTFCKVKYQAHTKAAEKFNALYINTTAPVIILSAITTLLASYNGIPNFQWLATVVAIFSGATTVGQALVSFLEFKNKYQDHHLTAMKYIALMRTIESDFYVNYYSQEISSDPVLKEKYIKAFFEKIQIEFNNIQSSAPVFPSDIADMDLLTTKIGANEVDDVLIDIVETPLQIQLPSNQMRRIPVTKPPSPVPIQMEPVAPPATQPDIQTPSSMRRGGLVIQPAQEQSHFAKGVYYTQVITPEQQPQYTHLIGKTDNKMDFVDSTGTTIGKKVTFNPENMIYNIKTPMQSPSSSEGGSAGSPPAEQMPSHRIISNLRQTSFKPSSEQDNTNVNKT